MPVGRDERRIGKDGAIPSSRTPQREERSWAARFADRWAVFLILGLGLVLLLPHIRTLALVDVDESRYAIITKSMVDSGEWLVLRLDDQPYFRKPPLFFWLAAALEVSVCSGPWAGRTVSVLASLLVGLLTFDLAKTLWNRKTGLLAALMVLTSIGILVCGRLYRMDLLLVLCTTFSLWCFCRMEFGQTARSGTTRWKWWMLFYLGAALGTLTKGPVALGLPALIVLAHLALQKRWKHMTGLLNPAGIAVYLLVALPWFVAIGLRFPGYFETYFVTENLGRFGTADLGHPAPLWFYPLSLFLGFLPWSCWLPLVVVHSFPRRPKSCRQSPETCFFWIWILVVVVFFSMARTKFPQYILPAWPALALLSAHAFVERWNEPARRGVTMLMGAAAFAVLAPGLTTAMLVAGGPEGIPAAGSIALLVLSGATVIVLALLVRRISTGGLCVIVCVFMCLSGLIVTVWVEPGVFEHLSCRGLGLEVRKHIRAADALIFHNSRRHSFPYYAGRTHALKLEGSTPDKPIRQLMHSGRRIWYLLPDQASLDDLRGVSPDEVHLIARHGKKALLCNRALPGGSSPAKPAPGPSRPETVEKP